MEDQSQDKLYIFYATSTGNSAEIALQFLGDVKSKYNEKDCTTVNLKHIKAPDFLKVKRCALFLSTYHNGTAPYAATKFEDWIFNEKNHEKGCFSHLKFLIFAIGDAMNYPSTFTKFGRDVYKVLTNLGATCYGIPGYASSHNGRLLSYYDSWKNSCFDESNSFIKTKQAPQIFLR